MNKLDWPDIPGRQMNPVKKGKCEVCGGSVEVAGNTTKYYINKDQEKIKELKSLLRRCDSWLSLIQEFPVEKDEEDIEDLENLRKMINE